jgi:exopolysaccharide production protein ExoY
MSATCLAPVRQIIRTRESRRWFVLVHAIERVAAGGMLIVLAPALLLLALLIWAISRRPPLVAHLRVGQDGRPLWVLKFRTMWGERSSLIGQKRGLLRTRGAGDRFWSPVLHGPAGRPRKTMACPSSAAFKCTQLARLFRDKYLVEYVEERACPVKLAGDTRVTSRFARFCRRHSIDELPQLIHVLCGQMSLVGPRPITAVELQEHYGEYAAEVLAVRPGLTGLWQIMGRNRLSYRQRLRLDLFLVRHCRGRLYLRVFLRSIPRVVTGKDAW